MCTDLTLSGWLAPFSPAEPGARQSRGHRGRRKNPVRTTCPRSPFRISSFSWPAKPNHDRPRGVKGLLGRDSSQTTGRQHKGSRDVARPAFLPAEAPRGPGDGVAVYVGERLERRRPRTHGGSAASGGGLLVRRPRLEVSAEQKSQAPERQAAVRSSYAGGLVVRARGARGVHDQGIDHVRERAPGSAAAQRINAKDGSVRELYAFRQWRSVIVADIIGHRDTAAAAYMVAQTLNCY
jgi:hypothetical protein